MLHELGYSNVRDYRGGIADWVESGEPTESVTDTAPPAPDPSSHDASRPSACGFAERSRRPGPRALSRMRRLDNSALDLVQQRSTLQLFVIWIGTILLSGACYWLGALMGEHGLVEGGRPVGADLNGFASAIYFSFVTATSIGYGDIVPVGGARVIAVAEAIAALLIFGAVVAKFVSHRQEELVSEIHRVTFEERLARIETNLHMVISELLSITAMCEAKAPLESNQHPVGKRRDPFLGRVAHHPRSALSAAAGCRGRRPGRDSRHPRLGHDRAGRPPRIAATGILALAAPGDYA